VNRETRRMTERQGEVEPDEDDLDVDQPGDDDGGGAGGGAGGGGRSTRSASGAGRQPTRQRTGVVQFFREVRDEMRQVAWPSRSELINYTAVVVTVLAIMITLIYFLNLGFAHMVLWLFTK